MLREEKGKFDEKISSERKRERGKCFSGNSLSSDSRLSEFRRFLFEGLPIKSEGFQGFAKSPKKFVKISEISH